MPYNYDIEKQYVFTDRGQRQFLEARDFCSRMLKQAGAVRASEAMAAISGGGNSWSQMACIDRLVELGELREITDSATVAWQYRVFVRARE